MVFTEEKKEDTYHYYTEDVFGKLTLESTVKLEPDVLDGTTLLILKQGKGAKVVEGEVKHTQGVLTYRLERAVQWEEAEEDIPLCEDTPTLTPEPENAFIAIYRGASHFLKRLRLSGEAFLQAWKRP